MRTLGQYSIREWFYGTPLVHAFKQMRNDIIQNIYRRIHPKSLKQFLKDTSLLQGKTIAVVIAFNQPWVVDWLTRMSAKYVHDTTWLVFDNSSRKDIRPIIEMICRKRNIPYLSLPRNLERHPCRSHGIALTWIYYNVIQRIKPRIFAFIDHDLIPLEKIEFDKILGNQVFYGILKRQPLNWIIWAGYSIYNFSAVSQLPLNFNNDVTRRLDTGGRNWKCLYKNFDPSQLNFAACKDIEILDPKDGVPQTVSLVDHKWIHLCGAGYSKKFDSNFEFFERIAKAMDGGATLKDLVSEE
jgi:hypothetical protein